MRAAGGGAVTGGVAGTGGSVTVRPDASEDLLPGLGASGAAGGIACGPRCSAMPLRSPGARGGGGVTAAPAPDVRPSATMSTRGATSATGGLPGLSGVPRSGGAAEGLSVANMAVSTGLPGFAASARSLTANATGAAGG